MIPDRLWQQDMTDGTHAACMAKKCGCGGAGRLRESIKKPINHQRMYRDTFRRTGGKCPTQRGYLQRQFAKLAEAFKNLSEVTNQSRR